MRDFFEEVREMIMQSNLPGIAGAILVLVIGWLVALWLSGAVSSTAENCAKLRKHLPGGDDENELSHAGKMAGKITYWIVMIMVILGCMSLLQLEYAAIPLREFLVVLARYLPNIAGALLLIVIARIVAGIVRAAVRKIIKSRRSSTVMSEKLGMETERAAGITAESAGFLVYLFFLPAILNALGIYGITAPLQAMFAVALIYLPRLVAALVILLIGFWAAKIVRKGVGAALNAVKMDEVGNFFGFKKFSGHSFIALCSRIAWILVVIPVIIAALAALDIAILSQSISVFLNILLAGAGNIIGAVLIVFAAYLIARLSDRMVQCLSSAAGIDKFWQKSGIRSEKVPEFPLSAVIGKIVMITVMVLGILAACEILHFTVLSDVIRRFAVFGGNLILSLIILLIGIAGAQFFAGLMREKFDRRLICAVKFAVIVFAAILALSNLNIGQAIVEIAFAMILGAVCLAGGLAFGLGGREFAAGILEDLRTRK